jgi:hypothetical protein
MLKRIIGVARAKVIPYLAALGAFGIAGAANGQTITFNFDDTPDDSECEYGTETNCFYFPSFEDEETGFGVAHGAGDDDRVFWNSGSDDGYISLYDHVLNPCIEGECGGDGAAIGFMEFVSGDSDVDVMSFELCLTYVGGDSAEIFPLEVDQPPPAEGELIGAGTTCLTFSEFDGLYGGLMFEIPPSAELQWDDLVINPVVSETSIRGILTSDEVEGPQEIINTPTLRMIVSQVALTGDTDFDTCVAQDVREHDGIYERRFLLPADVFEAEFGTCKGDLESPTLIPGTLVEVTTWEDLLTRIDFKIPPWTRTFPGEFEGEPGHWFVISSVRTSAEFIGANRVTLIPEEFPGLEFDDEGSELPCDVPLGQRPLSLALLAEALNEHPNVEGDLPILSTYRCNRPDTMTRRTQHFGPFYGDSLIFKPKDGLLLQLAGTGATLFESNFCAVGHSDKVKIAAMKLHVGVATAAALLNQWTKVRARLEAIAQTLAVTNFKSDQECLSRNYSGNIGARVVTADFYIFDRILQANVQGEDWDIYNPTGAIGAIVPVIPEP